MPDQQVRKARPVRARNELDEIALDLHRILLAREPEPLGQSPDVRVDDDPLRVPELGRDDVRRLPRDAGEPQQLGDRPWHLAVELLEQHPHRAVDRLRLLTEEPGLVDVALELLARRREVVLRPLVLRKERGRDLVDVHVGRLRREHHRDEELELGVKRQRDLGVRVLLGKELDDRADPLTTPPEPRDLALPRRSYAPSRCDSKCSLADSAVTSPRIGEANVCSNPGNPTPPSRSSAGSTG